MYCAIRQLGVTFSASASRTHNSPSHVKSNHLSFSASTLMHPSRRRPALLDLIKGATPDLSPLKWCHWLATSSTSPSPFLAFFVRCPSLSRLPRPCTSHSSHAPQSSPSHLAVLLLLYSTSHLCSPLLLIALSISLAEDQYQHGVCFSSLPTPPGSSRSPAHLLVCSGILF